MLLPPPARLAVLAPLVLALLTCAHTSVSAAAVDAVTGRHHNRNDILSRKVELPTGCLYDGRWHAPGALVQTREPCLLCACTGGALSCRRQTCAPISEPPPLCRLVHRRDECCPEMHCPDGVKKIEQQSSARYDYVGAPGPRTHDDTGTVLPACVEGGTVYAAGSAMGSNVACEQCFCLGGARRCVRPRCLPPPEGCQSQPSPGACCPQRYYCQHVSTTPAHERNPHDCQTKDGLWVPEGEKVSPVGIGTDCVQCFCLRGSVRCQGLSCAPTLKGCTPLVLPGHCCPHQYQCSYLTNNTKTSNLFIEPDNHLIPLNENRAFHVSKSTKRETTIKVMNTFASKTPGTATTTTKQTSTEKSLIKDNEKDTKIILRSSEPQENTDSDENKEEDESSSTTIELDNEEDPTTKTYTTDAEEITTITNLSDNINSNQPERSVKIVINGTVNCTTELSSSTLLLNTTNTSDTVWIKSDIHQRVPFIDENISETYTVVPSEIITKRVYNDDFNDNDSFIINVTSSLVTNNSNIQITSTTTTTTTTTSTTPRPKTVPPMLVDGVNASKSKKDQLDYDYIEPTLPPSLPNLKIIPFVAADAVVDGETLPRETPSFTATDIQNRFPVYYPGKETKEDSYPTRREDNYNSAQYPLFVSKNEENLNYPSLTQSEELEAVNPANVNTTDGEDASVHEFTVAALLSNMADVHHKSHVKLTNSNVNSSRTPPINLFSPPVETEGGFIPKSPGVTDDFYSVYSSTSPRAVAPHLTTSMQIETKEDCISSDGRHISEGTSINIGCSVCTCAWNELHCSPRTCQTPPGCERRAAGVHALDICCGELICGYENTTNKITNTFSAFKNRTEMIEINTDNIVKRNTTILNNTEQELYKEEDSPGGGVNVTSNNTQVDHAPVAENSSPENDFVSKVSTFNKESLANDSQPPEYEDEDDEDGGFSLGSVLKLLLSENYDNKPTTLSPIKKTNTIYSESKYELSTPRINSIESTTKINKYETYNKFIPMPPFKPVPNTISRIDHLLLGELSTISETNTQPSSTVKSTSRPSSTARPTIASTKKHITSKTTRKPFTSSAPTIHKEVITEKSEKHIEYETRPPSYPSGFGLGLPKLAGCNIYGQMYRVGRIITELSTPCQECRCTEFGVDCKSLNC